MSVVVVMGIVVGERLVAELASSMDGAT